jgi:nitrite reductase/ring-hydroxylating ferredoxin subunit
MRRFELHGVPPIALYNLDGAFHATADTCTHAQASLTEGDLEGDEVICPVHFGAFHVPSGRALCFPVTEDLRTYPVRLAGGDVHVELT